MKSQIEQRKDFDSKIYNDPIELLQTIQQHTLNYQESIHIMEIIDNALVKFQLLKQKDEPLYQYARRFKTAKEIVESHVGATIEFTKYIKGHKSYDEKDQAKINKIKEELGGIRCI